MTNENIRTTLLIIERPLLPKPPVNTEPYWCYVNTLMFKDKITGKILWEQQIPEADLKWIPKKDYYEYDKYFSCNVFKNKYFGWQLRCAITHEKAKLWLENILQFIKESHEAHLSNPIHR